MHRGTPVIYFNGVLLVDTLETGSIQVISQSIPAIRITVKQITRYPVIAHGRIAAEIYAYCFAAHQKGYENLEAYSPCYLIADQHKNMLPVIASITLYISAALREESEDKIHSVMNGEHLEDGAYPLLQKKPFAVFKTFKEARYG